MKSKSIPILAAILIPVLAVAASLAYIYFDKVSTVSRESFSYNEYMSSPAGLNGNQYSFLATIDSQLSRTPTGRVVSVRDSVGNPRFAVFIPNSLNANISANQKYRFGVKIESGGAIVVYEMKKF